MYLPSIQFLHDAGYRRLVDWPGPQLAICRSFQLVSALYGEEVRPMPPRSGLETREAGHYETGACRVEVEKDDLLFAELSDVIEVQQNHRNEVVTVPKGFIQLAGNTACPIQAWRHTERPLYGTQFHPEAGNHPDGIQILKNLFGWGVATEPQL